MVADMKKFDFNL